MNGALYDDDAFYDGEFYYDAPLPKKGNIMARIAMKTGRLTPTAMAARLLVSLTAIAENSSIFTGATAVLALGNTKHTTLVNADALVASLLVQLAEAREARDLAETAAVNFYGNELATYVSNIAKGSAEIIIAAGMDVVQARGPSPAMTQVLNVKLTAGLDEGTAQLKWDTIFRSRSYEVQLSTNINSPTAWEVRDIITEPALDLSGLTSGQKCWARVRAINNVNKGPWSDPACCMIP
jgi:hypothetical protein